MIYWIILIVGLFMLLLLFLPVIIASYAHFRAVTYAVKGRDIALTFDDGPNPPYTNQLLKVLKKHNIKATFFVVGENLKKYPELGRMIVGDGHIIANHSSHHKFISYLTDPSFKDEIVSTQDAIFECTGKLPTLFRAPWLMNNKWIKGTLSELGMHYVSGKFGSHREIRGISEEQIVKDTLKKVKPGQILIFHDGYDTKGGNRKKTIDAIDLLIPKLTSMGYQFVTPNELILTEPYLS